MFSRTTLGIGNEYLFHDVDLVVYCEGKNVEGEGSSLDEVFWERVFVENGKNVYCKSMGGKSTLLPIAQKVIDEDIGNVVVAMDRDYDDLRNQIIDHPQVFYTYGYSWESDVILDFQFGPALSLFATTNRRQAIKNEFLTFRNSLSRALRRICALDFKYFDHTDKLFDRQRPMSIIATPGGREPSVKTSTLLCQAKALGNFQTGPLPDEVYKTLCGVRSFFGKVVSRIVFHWFAYRTRRINGSRRVVYEAFMTLLANTLELSDQGVRRNVHYSSAIARL